jgi:hypothetical protein
VRRLVPNRPCPGGVRRSRLQPVTQLASFS